MHPGQLSVSVGQARALVADSFPEFAGRTVRRVASGGTVNALFRVGGDHVARLPLQPGPPEDAWATARRETAAADELARATSVLTPVPVGIGAPGHGYPLPWTLQTWVRGTVATASDPADSVRFAEDLAGFVDGLRRVDTRGRTFSGGGRGGRLADMDEWLEICFEKSVGVLDDVPGLRALWRDLRATGRDEPDVMSHGDLVPGNVLVRQGRLAGVIDGGQFGPADPALDLVAAWHLLDPAPRQVFRDRLGCPDAQWQRGKAWAFAQAMGLPWYYLDSNATMAAVGRRTLGRILADG
jgi:aminoglycoside phosphotransferase (APT) family kinase protein